ncbi:MAG: glycosyltransferase [Alicyclobacillaceae bacterium]|nr:glycosyltransferase [Alicyclobacillaceae bacterium]
MRVGVVMPLFTQEPHYLDLALDSMARQTFRDYRLVVVVDGADDRTAAAAERWRSRLPMTLRFRRDNRGIAHSLNEGFAMLETAEYWTWISSDNVYDPDFLRVLVETLDRSPPRVGLVYSRYRIIDARGRQLPDPIPSQEWPKERLLDFCFIGPSFLYRRQFAQLAGPYEPFFDPVQDYEFWLRLTEYCDIRHIPVALMSYRIHHPSSVTTRLYADPALDRTRREKALQAVNAARRRRSQNPNGERRPEGMQLSVVIPSFNAREPLLLTLAALDRQEGAEGRFEVIVADDGSTDGTAETLATRTYRFPLRVLTLKHGGKCRARNEGIQAARHPLILSLDADMILPPLAVAGHLAHHETAPGPLAVVGGWVPVRIYPRLFSQLHPEQQRDIEILLSRSARFRERAQSAGPASDGIQTLLSCEDVSQPEVLASFAIRPSEHGHPLYAMWEAVLRRHGQNLENFRFPWMSFITGNVSFPKEEALAAGLFDERFTEWGFADWEMGYRLYRRGVSFRVDPRLTGYHQEHFVDGEHRALTARQNYRYCTEKHPTLDWYLLHKSYPGQWGVGTLQQVLEEWERLPDGDPLKIVFEAFARHFSHLAATGAFEQLREVTYDPYDRLLEWGPECAAAVRRRYAEIRRAGGEAFCRAFVELAAFPLGGGSL